jgi:hypothetical protein
MSLTISSRDRRILEWIALWVGALLTAAGLCGVWLQGRFYHGGFPTAATIGEVREAFTWPTAFTTAGSLVVAAVILSGTLTSSWPPRLRLVAFILFGLFVLLACTVCGYFAVSQISTILN